MTYDFEVVTTEPGQSPCDVLAELLGDAAEYRVAGEPELVDADRRPGHWSEFWLIRVETQHRLSETELEDLGAAEVTP